MSRTVHDLLKCGNCGGEQHRVFHVSKGDGPRVGGHGDIGFDGHIETECVRCSLRTIIKPTPSRLTTTPGPNADGTLCGGWK